MARKQRNLARESSATVGTGVTVDLAGNVAGFVSFHSAGAADGDQITYSGFDKVNNAREIGFGRYFFDSNGPSISRDTPLISTNSNARINLSGTSEWVITPAAEDLDIQTMLDIIGATRGMVPVRGASSWSGLTLGAANTLLVSDGTDAIYRALTDEFDFAFGGSARGDVITRGASTWDNKALGAAGTVFSSDGTDPVYRTITALLDAVFGSTRGMVLRRGTSAWEALAIGAANSMFVTDGTDAFWGTLTLMLDACFGSTRGMTLRRGASGWQAVSVGAANTIMSSDGTDGAVYQTLTALIDSFGGAARGDTLTRGASAWDNKALGAANTIFSSDGTDAVYRTLTSLMDSVLSSTRGTVAVRGASAWTAVGAPAVTEVLGGDGTDTVFRGLAAIMGSVFGNTRGQLIRRGASGYEALALGATGKSVMSDGTDVLYGFPSPHVQETAVAAITHSSSSGKMIGTGLTFTPSRSGKMLIFFQTTAYVVSNQQIVLQMAYGTGTPPAAGDAAVGTPFGPPAAPSEFGGYYEFYDLAGLVQLTPGTTYWFDCQSYALGGTSMTITNSVFDLFEI